MEFNGIEQLGYSSIKYVVFWKTNGLSHSNRSLLPKVPDPVLKNIVNIIFI